MTDSKANTSKSLYDFNLKNIKGQEWNLSDLKGKVTLVVNVASKCGFTPQYKGLEALYQQYKDQGFTIIGCPCNQFGSQEPGSADDIVSFCSRTYDVTFPLTEKLEVNGSNEHELYAFLKSSQPGILGIQMIKWNFEKFLVDKNGKVVRRYSSMTKPEDIAKDVDQFLKA
ncbi:glutathione peroxidase [Umbelopsis sp. PMI_123]|nr:glutathione peroxidase [Umbelopsis sp. PMI_123]